MSIAASPEISTRTETIAILVGFTGLAIATTYPLVFGLGTRLPSDLGDPVLTVWTLAWGASRIPHGLSGLWDAPNFFPYRHTLAYSDHLLGITLFTAPLQWLTGNPILVYNLAFMASVVLAGVGMYVLARSLVGRRDAALLAGVIYACLPFRASHLAHLQWLMTGWLPLGLWALHRYFKDGKWPHLVASAACLLLQILTATYFLYFAVLPFGVVWLWEMARRPVPGRRLVRHVGPILVVLIVTIWPVARAYYGVRQEQGLRRSVEDIASQSADVADYFRAAPRLRLWGRLGTSGGERELFAGVIVVALAGLSLVELRRVRAIAIYATIAALAFVLSLGPTPTAWGLSLHVPGPYRWLLQIVPGLDGIRAVARLGLLVSLALTVLAAFGAAWLFERVAPRGRLVLVAALVAGAVAEGWAAPIPTPAFSAPQSPGEGEVYEWLRQSPPGGVFEAPASLQQFERESRYQYLTLMHGHRIVNGQSGYPSPLFNFLGSAQSPLNEVDRVKDAIAALRAVGVSYLVVHHEAFENQSLAGAWRMALADPAQILRERRSGDTSLATLSPSTAPPPPFLGRPVATATIRVSASDGADRLEFLFDGNSDTRWLSGRPQSGSEWMTLELDRPRDIAMVRMVTAQRSFGDYPRDLSVEALGKDRAVDLFRGSVLPALARGLLVVGDYPPIDITLPPNQSRVLRLRQLGTSRRFFWSIHELQLFER